MRSLSFAQLSYLVRHRLLHQHATYQSISTRRWTIYPQETRAARSAVYFDDELDRISKENVGDTSYGFEMLRLEGGTKAHAATVAYCLENIELVNGSLYSGALRQHLDNSPLELGAPTRQATLASSALACTRYGNIYFGHWLGDDLPLHLAAEALDAPAILQRTPYAQESSYRDLFAIKANRWSRVRFRRLIVLDDVGQNTYRQQRYEQLRARLRAAVRPTGNRFIYLRRGRSAALAAGSANDHRLMANADEVEAYLVAQGFVTVDPDQCSALQMVEAVLGATIVVGIEGSHMAHALYSIRDQGAICIVQPPRRFTNVFKDYADCLGLWYGFTVGVRAERGFTVQVDNLARIIDRLIGCAESRN